MLENSVGLRDAPESPGRKAGKALSWEKVSLGRGGDKGLESGRKGCWQCSTGVIGVLAARLRI